ncbi:MAG TPA: TIGR03560 family F420-dependent LLM class oxidoreductase [Acidimicrobiia bacterium]|nr:TIGR03560 family F420-dependent LLM class oxidoreductase [Acidimicrobiia bacterium]
MRFAIKTPPQHGTWADFLDVWKAADQIELFESAWNFDHFYPLTEPHSGPCLEGWTMLAAMAQATSRLRLGCMVSAMHHRHPAVTANMAATLDLISGGRFDLGMGAGWNEMESDAYGLRLGPVKERLDRFEEGIEVILSLLTNDLTNFQGRFYQLTDARCEPKGLQRPPPLVIGGKGRRRTLRLVARYASGWDCMAVPPGEWQELHEVLLEHCSAVGRDPTEITTMAHVRMAAGSDPAELADRAASYQGVGVDLVVFSMGPPYRARALEPLAHALSDLG